MQNAGLAKAKAKANRLGLLVQKDRQTGTLSVLVRGVAGPLFSTVRMSAVERFLLAYAAKKAAEG